MKTKLDFSKTRLNNDFISESNVNSEDIKNFTHRQTNFSKDADKALFSKFKNKKYNCMKDEILSKIDNRFVKIKIRQEKSIIENKGPKSSSEIILNVEKQKKLSDKLKSYYDFYKSLKF